MSPVPGDQAARTALLTDLDTTFVVEAAAGTGKTTVLVGRMVAVVKAGRALLSQVISVTFTEKAAGELKLKLRDALEREREATPAGPEHERLTRALEELEVARLGTIHGLCADLLREYPVEAGVDPLFEVAADADAAALLRTAFQRQFQELLRSPPEGVRRLLRRRGASDAPPRRVLLDAVQALLDHRDFRAPWRRDRWERASALDALVATLTGFADLLAGVHLAPRTRSEPWLLGLLRSVRRLVDDLAHREAVAARDHDGLEAQVRGLTSNARPWESPAEWGLEYRGVTQAEVLEARARTWAALQTFVRDADADLAALLHAELWPVVEAYEAEKARRGVLDFVDLLLKTRDLVTRQPRVRRELQTRFTHLFVDEFQDTDPLQSELVLLLAADDPDQAEPFATRCVPGKLFVVGDPKQSIYRFRRADVALYQRVKAHLVSHGARLEHLSTSFRATPGIQAAINACFERVMGGPGDTQAAWVPLGPSRPAHDSQPSVIALPAPRPFNEKGKATKELVEASLPEAVAGLVEWLVRKSGWTVEEDGARVPLEARHVCLLFKRLRGYRDADLPRPYAQALEARRLPHVLVGGRSFHAREEVAALRTALAAVERPDDELSVFATLRGPFFALSDEALLVFKHQVGRLHPARPLDAQQLGPQAAEVAQALEVLRRLHQVRHAQPVATTLQQLLEATRAQAGVAFWTAGQQALANVLQLTHVVRRTEQRALSFRDVVEALQEAAEEGEAPDAPLVEEGTEGVRMMTVHAAKGLEFPVVILVEPTANAARKEPSHWADPATGLWVHALAHCLPVELREHEAEVLQRDLEESVRLTYVAATRARDVLVVPVCSERRFEGTWLSVLEPAVWPGPGSLHAPREAPGCPPFGRDVVVDRPGPLPPTVPLPGRHLAESGRNGVVWWDPRVLELGRDERSGLEASEALQDDPDVAPRVREAHQAWLAARVAAVERGATPRYRVRVARDHVEAPPPDRVEVASTLALREGRPGGRRFGELVHAVLAHVPLDAQRPAVAAAVEVHARALLASAEERRAAVDAVEAALAHPLLAAARGADEARREAPVVDVAPGGEVLEGTIDLAFREGEAWTVVEFKTDDVYQQHRVEYEAQTWVYVRAIAAATGRTVKGVLLRV